MSTANVVDLSHRIPFSLPVQGLHSTLFQMAESYLRVGGKNVAVCKVSHSDRPHIECNLIQSSEPFYLTLLKVASYITIILPALALLVKFAYRNLNTLTVIKSNQPKEDPLASHLRDIEKQKAVFADGLFGDRLPTAADVYLKLRAGEFTPDTFTLNLHLPKACFSRQFNSSLTGFYSPDTPRNQRIKELFDAALEHRDLYALAILVYIEHSLCQSGTSPSEYVQINLYQLSRTLHGLQSIPEWAELSKAIGDDSAHEF